MKKFIKIEGIPNFTAKWYALIARKSPCIIDIHKEVAQEVCSKISFGKILDIGTGPGYVPFEIAKRSPKLEIIGIDLSSGMIRIADKNAKDLGFSSRVKFQLANAASLPFEEGYFDFAISTLSLHHWSSPKECINEIYRVLKKNGQAYIYDLQRDTTKEVNRQVRQKYGWFLSFLFLKIVRAHSSISLKEAQEILSSVDATFSKKSVEEQGIILKLNLLK